MEGIGYHQAGTANADNNETNAEGDKKFSDPRAMVGANNRQINARIAGIFDSGNQSLTSEWEIPTKYPTDTGPKKLTDQQSMNQYRKPRPIQVESLSLITSSQR